MPANYQLFHLAANPITRSSTEELSATGTCLDDPNPISFRRHGPAPIGATASHYLLRRG